MTEKEIECKREKRSRARVHTLSSTDSPFNRRAGTGPGWRKEPGTKFLFPAYWKKSKYLSHHSLSPRMHVSKNLELGMEISLAQAY